MWRCFIDLNIKPIRIMKVIKTIKSCVVILSIYILLIGCSSQENLYCIETEVGNITLEVYPKKAPITVSNFLKSNSLEVF